MHMKNKQYVPNLIVITSYPEKGKIHGVETVGIASYTKNTLLSILKAAKKIKKNPHIVVLAEQINTEKENIYTDEGMKVYRIWKRGSILTYFQLTSKVLRFWQTKKILIEFELSMFGHYLNLILFPLFLLLLKIFGKEIIFVSHQVVDDIGLISGHIGIEKNSFKADMINVFISFFYRLTLRCVSKVIVFEDYLKEKLSKFIDKEKIVVIPHGVESFKNVVKKDDARKILGLKDEFIILYFGFIAWYKGTDWIVEKIKNEDIKLIIAGGANPNHKDKKFYMNYVKNVTDQAEKTNGNIITTGFVEEKQIPLYFSACNLVVMPYRTLMSSSGPLSLALSFQKPFLISQPMEGIGRTKDFSEIMDKCKIELKDICFDLSDNSFEKKISRLSEKKEFLKGLSTFSKMLNRKRSFEKIGNQYYQEIFL